MTTEEYNKILLSDDWKMQIILAYKKDLTDPILCKINMPKFIESLKEDILVAETGMDLGVGWHGGMTREEWQQQKEYDERVLKEAESILSIKTT